MRRSFPLVLLVFAGAASAAVRTVPTDHATIQAALDASAPGDTVYVLAGNYTGPGNRDLDFGGKDLLLESYPMDPAGCVIDCAGSEAEPHRGFWFHGGETSACVVRGFTVIGGWADQGGGVLVGDETTSGTAGPIFDSCWITECEAQTGAGIAVTVEGSTIGLIGSRIAANIGHGLAVLSNAGIRQVVRTEFTDNKGSGLFVQGNWSMYWGEFTECSFSGNLEYGAEVGSQFCDFIPTQCSFDGNDAGGIWMSGSEAGYLTVSNCTVRDNLGPGIWTRVVGCGISSSIVTGNLGNGITSTEYGFFTTLSGSLIADNGGWGVEISVFKLRSSGRSAWGIDDCRIQGNGFGGVSVDDYTPVDLEYTNNLIIENGGDGFRLTLHEEFPLHALVGNNTIASNQGTGIVAAAALPCTLRANIVAFNGELGLSILDLDSLTVINNDLYGNTGGDWSGTAAPYEGLDGNFSANPLFIAPFNHDYELAENSPCRAGNHPDGYDGDDVGAEPVGGETITFDPDRVDLAPPGPAQLHPGDTLPLSLRLLDAGGVPVPDEGAPPSLTAAVGLGDLAEAVLAQDAVTWTSTFKAGAVLGVDTLLAHDPECASVPDAALVVNVTDASIIESVRDIPGDQGLQVRVTWRAAAADTLGDPDPVTDYAVWRRVGAGARDGRPVRTTPFLPDGGDALLRDGGGVLWEPAGPTLPAMMWERYAMTCPTLADSTAAGPALAVFMVSAHHVTPQTFSTSWPDSGSSVDDLAPAPPGWLVASPAPGGVRLDWGGVEDADLVGYRVYGQPVGTTSPDDAIVLAETAGTWWLDADPDATLGWFVRSYDDGGNESAAILSTVTDVASPAAAPGLRSVYPNPFNPSTRIDFGMAATGRVRVAVFDPRGRRVRTLLDGVQPAGERSVTWDGTDDRGRALPSGVYVLSLETPGATSRRTVLLAR